MNVTLPSSPRLRLQVLAVILLGGLLTLSADARLARNTLPAQLSDTEFWRLTEQLSEPDGWFRSDNLVSNEVVFGRVVPELVARARAAGVYLGVGPEQNFTYIAATRPRLAFILDIRRGNMQLLLLYKALFELSPTRASFVAKLFNRTLPAGLSDAAPVSELFREVVAAPTQSDAAYRAHLQAVFDVLEARHKFPLTSQDRDAIDVIYESFRKFGPHITWNSSSRGTPGGRATYAELMQQNDSEGQALSYLASEATFATVKDLFARNLIIPVVGDFAGPKALRAIGDYVRSHNSIVNVFYLSNVESYLRQDNKWLTFCSNVAALPLDAASVFIRPMGVSIQPSGPVTLGTPLASMAEEVRNCAEPR